MLRSERDARRAMPLAGVVACILLAAFALPAAAPAKRGLVTGFTGPDNYQTTDASKRALWFDRTVDAGAGIVRIGLSWAAFGGAARPADPTNPGSASYDFSAIDGAVRDAQARGVKVMFTINSAPPWAEGPGRPPSAFAGAWKPNPSDVADFAQAVAARYSGTFDPDGIGPEPTLPAVEALQVWNEPNQDAWLAPQFQGKTIIGADRYREILNLSYNAIKSVNPKMLVVTGGTSPYGDPPGGPYSPGNARVRPVQWWRSLLCLTPAKGKKAKKGKKGKKGSSQKLVRTKNCPGKPMFDVFAHQPIDNTGGGPLKSGPSKYDASTPDLGRVVEILRAAERAGTVLPGRHPVWVTEFWWDSKPPNSVGAPLGVQARWIEQTFYLYWKAGASVAINFEIQDVADLADVHAGLQSGVYFLDGRPKPSLTAFRFPFVTERVNRSTLRAWGKSPAAGKLRIQRRGGGWKTVRTLKVAKGAVFTAKLRLSGKQRLRAVVGGQRSLVWKQAATVAGAKSSKDDSGLPGLFLALGGLVLALAAGAVLRRRQVVRRRKLRRMQRRRGPRPLTG
jgi:hypothetical protein